MLVIKKITNKNEEWQKSLDYIKICSWSAKHSLLKKLASNEYRAWERLFIVEENDKIVAYCMFAMEDGIHVAYYPFISYVFVGEMARGRRISEKMIDACIAYAKELNFTTVYVVSNHNGLYEKYGFEIFDHQPNRRDEIQKVYKRNI